MTPTRSGPGALAGAAEAKGNTTGRRIKPNFSREQEVARAFAWGERPAPRRLRLRSFRPLAKGALRGFATVELPCGLVLCDVAIFAGRNGLWASLPSKPRLDQNGRHRSDINGKPQYTSVAEWKTRELADRFSTAVIALIRAGHPGSLDGAGR
jgi:hypothetical protein